ncbi:MAG: hypothetical protein FJ316_10740 [SAR202 cluster bacterium]|nr:hypothetical protein [SAR202 cluster bacterium]
MKTGLSFGLLLVAVGLVTLLGGASCAPQEDPTAPDFTLPSADGRQAALSQLLQEHRAVVLVFYRGLF